MKILEASTTITQRHSPTLDESVWSATLDCGLHLIFAPRPGFAGNFGVFTTRYGSMHSRWQEGKSSRTLPDGVAHFLEHQLFKKKRGDLSDEFASTGAYVNAQTSHTSTSYFFDGAAQFETNLDLLLELCLTPHFDQKSVDLEREIIIQEIKSYRDQPYWVNYQRLLEALYHEHPVRRDIAGDEDSVSHIGPKLLGECHERFYQPSNCSLIVSGDFDAFDLVDLANRLCNKHLASGYGKRKRAPMPSPQKLREPAGVRVKREERAMYTPQPNLMIGFKDSAILSGVELLQRETALRVALDVLFGASSACFEELYDEGLIAGDFGTSAHIEPSFCYIMIGGETPEPDELEARIDARITTALKEGFDPVELRRKARKAAGRMLSAFHSPEATAFTHLSGWLGGYDPFTAIDFVESLTADDMVRVARECFKPNGRAVSLIKCAGA